MAEHEKKREELERLNFRFQCSIKKVGEEMRNLAQKKIAVREIIRSFIFLKNTEKLIEDLLVSIFIREIWENVES